MLRQLSYLVQLLVLVELPKTIAGESHFLSGPGSLQLTHGGGVGRAVNTSRWSHELLEGRGLGEVGFL